MVTPVAKPAYGVPVERPVPDPVREPHWLRETRSTYDRVATSYADLLADALEHSPTDRAVLGLFADLVGPGARVADLGCGPGRLTAHLVDRGLAARGIDLSPGMVATARERHPGVEFEVGDLRALPLGDATLDGALAWYSLIHVPPDVRPAVVAELARVLRPGGELVVAFQVGDDVRRLREAYGHTGLGMDAWRLEPDEVTGLLAGAGIHVHLRLVRDPEGMEKTPQAYLVGRRD